MCTYVSGVFCIKWWYNITWDGEIKDLQFFWVSLLLSLLHSFFQSTLLLHTLIIQLSSSRSWVFQTNFLWKNYNNLVSIIILIIFMPVCVCVCVSDFYVFCKLGLSLFCLPSSLSINTPDFLCLLGRINCPLINSSLLNTFLHKIHFCSCNCWCCCCVHEFFVCVWMYKLFFCLTDLVNLFKYES